MKQKIIPTVNTPESWKNGKNNLRKIVLEYIKNNLVGETIVNEETKISIIIKNSSARKTAMGEAMYFKKAVATLILKDILKNAIYNNFGARKANDSPQILGYLNFKCKVKIDGKIENLRIAIQLQKGGKFYYNIEVNKKG